MDIREVGLDLVARLARAVGLRDDLHEAAAKPALLIAEGEMDVEGDRRPLRIRACARGFGAFGGRIGPLRSRRVGRVPRALDVVFLEQLRRHRERLATQANRDGAHAREVSTGSGARAAATNAATYSGGVGGRMPWPRFTMWPTRPGPRPAGRAPPAQPSANAA